MDNLSSSNSHLAETGLVELHRELAQAWGIDFQRVRALVCQLTSSNWCSISELITRTILSHWNVTHLLRRLHPWLESEGDHVRIRAAFQDLFRAVFDCFSRYLIGGDKALAREARAVENGAEKVPEGDGNAYLVLIALQPGMEPLQEMGDIPVGQEGPCDQLADRAPVAARELAHEGPHALKIDAPGLSQLVMQFQQTCLRWMAI